jgi:Dolichyl-phosphate-mannose-protein mannosyltransferase
MTDRGGSGQTKTVFSLFLFFLAVGIFFRVYDLGERNLWTDEAWVALAATQSTPSAALQAGKSTPPLYLLTVWGLVQACGRSETVLRLTSCLLGLGSLILLWPLVRALLPPWYALTAFALASISYRLVYFSKELKQYSADIFMAVLIFFLVERQLQRQGRDGWLWFTILLAVGLGFSHSLVFLLPVAALVLWWKLPQHRRATICSFMALGVVFLGYYWFFFRGQVDPELLVYWQCDFPDVTCGRNFACWLGGGLSRFGRYFFHDWGAPLGLVFLAAGLLFFYQAGKARVIWYFWGPILAALAAAFVERYPFMGHAGGVRLMMFNAPMLYIVTGAGIAAIFDWLWRHDSARTKLFFTPHPDPLPSRGEGIITQTTFNKEGKREIYYKIIGSWNKLARIILVALVVFWLQPVKLWQENLHPPDNVEEIEPLIHYLQTHRQASDAIYVYYFARDPFNYYYQGPMENIIWGQSCQDTLLPLPPERLRQIDRLWLIFSHFETKAFVDGFVAQLLGPGWTKQLELSQPGAMLLCYLPPWTKDATRPAVSPPAL